MSMTCLSCNRVHGCADARVAHVCDSFEYTSLIASREALLHIVGEPAAIIALRKVKPMSTPVHPNTTIITNLVESGDLEQLEALREDMTIQLPFLVMAASHLTGDSTKVGAMLRNQKDKRAALIDLLKEVAVELGSTSSAPIADDAVSDAPVEVVEEAPKKKRRKRRTKAEIEAAKAAKEANNNESDVPQVVNAAPLNVDFDRAFNDVLSAISDSHKSVVNDVRESDARSAQRIDEVRASSEAALLKLNQLSLALIELEQQLLLTGVVLEPVVAKYLQE